MPDDGNELGDVTTETDPSQRDRSIERSLQAARLRAQERFERLVAAAFELIRETGSTEFTLQDVAERARVSLRTFYQHFSNRDELLLAAFEHAVATSIPALRQAVEAHDDPIEQLHAYVETMFVLTFEGEHPENRPFTAYHLHLAQTNPAALARVLATRTELLLGVLQRGIDRGEVRADIEPPQLALLLTQTLTAILHANVLGTYVVGAPLDVDTVWAFCLGSVRPLPT